MSEGPGESDCVPDPPESSLELGDGLSPLSSEAPGKGLALGARDEVGRGDSPGSRESPGPLLSDGSTDSEGSADSDGSGDPDGLISSDGDGSGDVTNPDGSCDLSRWNQPRAPAVPIAATPVSETAATSIAST